MSRPLRFQLEGTAAEEYERRLVPTFFRPWARVLLDRAAVTDGTRLLDVACGTGIVARSAAALVGDRGRVVGIDLNPQMLAVAGTTDADIRWDEGDAVALPYGDGEFDVAVCQQGLQFVPEPAAALIEMRRVTAPDGRVVLGVWDAIERQPVFASLVDSLDRHAGTAAGDVLRSPFALGRADLHALCVAAGFDRVQVDPVSLTADVGGAARFVEDEIASTPLAELCADLDERSVAAVVADVDAAIRQQGGAFSVANLVVTAS
jgi:SAM-dependent methyltransferase